MLSIFLATVCLTHIMVMSDDMEAADSDIAAYAVAIHSRAMTLQNSRNRPYAGLIVRLSPK